MLNTLAEDLDKKQQVELHETQSIFCPARDLACNNAHTFIEVQAEAGVEPGAMFRQLVLNDLRSQYGVTPLA